MNFRQILILSAVACLVAGLAAPAASAAGPQPQVGENTSGSGSNSTGVPSQAPLTGTENGSGGLTGTGADAGANNSTNNSSAGNGNGNGNGNGGPLSGIGNAVSAVTSPEESIESVWNWAAEKLIGAAEWAIGHLNNLLGTPTIENDGAWGILGTPTDGGSNDASAYNSLYDTVLVQYVFPLIGLALGFVAIIALILPVVSQSSSRKVTSLLVSLFAMAILIVASWEISAALHALSDGVTQFLLPDGEAIASELEIASIGPIGAVLGFAILGWTEALVLLFIQAVRYLALYLMPLILPVLFLMAYGGGHRRVKQIGSFGIWQYYSLLIMNWPTAFLLRVAYEMSWDWSGNDVINILMTLAVFFLAIIIPLGMSAIFALVGISVRGAVASTASNVASRTPSPGIPNNAGTKAKSAAGRLGQRGYNAGVSVQQRSRSLKQRTRPDLRSDGGTTSASSSRSASKSTSKDVTPNQRSSVTQSANSQDVTPNQRQGAARSRAVYEQRSPGQRRPGVGKR